MTERWSIWIPWGCLLGTVLLPACAGPGEFANSGPKTPSVEQSTGMATCQAAKDPMNPLVVEWPATAKTSLEAASQRGIVVVSYLGCTMKVLEGCDAGGSYGFKQLTPNKDRIDIDSESKLYAELPLGVASLKGELERGSRLALSYVSLGQQLADGQPMGLRGSCAGATHYVRSLTVGAYSLTAMSARGASGAASTMGTGVGAGAHERNEVLRHSGDPDACAAAPDSKDCRAILQVSLAALPQQQVAAGEKRAGFGQGLGGLAPLPTVEGLGEVKVDVSLAAADVNLLKAVQTAKRNERDAAFNSEQKRASWMEVASYSASHPYKEPALKRAREWAAVAVAEAQRARKAREVCDRNVQDSAKLKELEGLDDDVVPAAQKAAYRREFERAYSPFGGILPECEAWRAKAAESWVGEALARASKEQERRDAEAEQSRATRVHEEAVVAATKARESAESTRRWKTGAEITGLVLGGAGAVLVGIGWSQSSKAKEDCAGTYCPSANQDAADKAASYGNWGMAGLGAGLLLFAGGYFWPSPVSGQRPQSRSPAWRLTPGPGQAGIGTQIGF